MEYIINPMWFYWLQVADCARLFMLIIGLCAIATLVTCAILWAVAIDNKNYDCLYNPQKMDVKAKQYKKFTLLSVAFCFAAFGICVFLPSKETLISIMVARYATYDNAQSMVDAVKSAVDYIIQSIQQIE